MTDGPPVRVAFFAVLVAVFALLSALILEPFLSFLLGALLLSFLLYPLQRRLAPRLGEEWAALVLVVGAVAATAGSLALLALTLPANAAELSAGIERVVRRARLGRQTERVLGIDVPLGSMLASVPGRVVELLVGDLTRIVGTVTDLFLGVVLLVFLLYYLLKDGDRLAAWVRDVVPLSPATTDELFEEARTTTWAVLKGHVFIAVVQAVVSGVGLFVVGIPNVVFWTVVMMFAELFPVVGVAVVLGPAILYLVLVGRLLAAGFLFLYGMTAVALVDDYLRAYVVDRGSALHSATILVGVFGGVYAFGVMGLFYGPIVLGLFQKLVLLFDEHYTPGA